MRKKEEKKENKAAHIKFIVDGQEIGGGYCSECGCLLNKYLDERFDQAVQQLEWYVNFKKIGEKPKMKELRCPKCERMLKFGKIYAPVESVVPLFS